MQNVFCTSQHLVPHCCMCECTFRHRLTIWHASDAVVRVGQNVT